MTVSNWIKAKTYPRVDKVQQMADYFNVSRSDLTEEKKKAISVSSSTYPFLPTNVAAGLPENVSGITDNDVEHIDIPDSIMGKWAGHDDVYLMRINGQSMNNVIPDQSLIAVKPIDLENLNNSDIVVFSYEHEYSVKRFYKQDDKMVFRPDSDDIRFTDYITNVSNSDLKIHGKVVIYIVEQN
ncbi:XRE family transcriptional regulator [Lentibacillus salicampi]|uniref:XRE family transcriptional regulator n=2 Tax=Lentibacillus salicampi TaxID=175306 RepID=A0A4Y9ACQ7_9BACI|nr:XRE family transcriptional regulator [Lentibacillus salicampi]